QSSLSSKASAAVGRAAAAISAPAARSAPAGPAAAPGQSVAKPPASASAAEPGGAEPRPAPESGEAAGDVYSRFREHLEAMEQIAATGKAAPGDDEGQAAVGTGGMPEERVEISAAARAKAPAQSPPKTGAKPQQPEAPQPDEEEVLFADLRPSLAAGAEPAGKGQEGRDPSPADNDAPPAPLPPPDEVQAALERASSPENIREEGAALLRMAQEAHDEGNLAALQAALEQYGALLEETPDLVAWEAERLRLRLAVLHDRPGDVTGAYQEMLDHGYEPVEASLESEIDSLLEGLPTPGEAPSLRVALLVKALSAFRQAGDREAMDRLYGRIEAAQEDAGDERKLIQYYKNHLAIKEVLGDAEGRLELIDKIGKRYFKLGDTAPAKEYYEMGVKLRAELDTATASENGEAAGGGEAEAPPASDEPTDEEKPPESNPDSKTSTG
ncbi:MAG: hypothetical protein O7D96_09995, partial [SAR324 cluster bacterium]|nr:hypothetical protein [SAR324 cluster bacterium]